MESLCCSYSKEIQIIDDDIEKLYTENCGLLTDATFSEKEVALEKHLEIFVTDILKNKDKKYYQDRLTYETNIAYQWSENRRRKNRPFSQKTNNSY